MNTTPSSYSHPDQPIRHSYPLAITTPGFSTALSLTLKTSPFILARLGIFILFMVGAIVWLVICGGIAALFSGKNGQGGGGGLILFLLGFGLPAGLYAWLRHYVLYILKLGHVAVLTELITKGTLPENVNQVQYGKEIVTKRFAEINILFVIDGLVTGIMRAFNGTLTWIANILPIPGVQGITAIIEKIVVNATTFLDETIFSYNLARGDENVWRSSADGIVYYAQNVKEVLKTAAWALVLEYLITAILVVICLAPAAILSYLLPGPVAGFSWVFALILAAAIRAAALHPLFLTMVALTFHRQVHQQPIDQSMVDTVAKVSDKFATLREKASEWITQQTSSAKGKLPSV